MKNLINVLFVFLLISLAGCASKTKREYIEPEIYQFQKIDTSNAYIELTPTDEQINTFIETNSSLLNNKITNKLDILTDLLYNTIQTHCVPPVITVKDTLKEIKSHYDRQIDDYMNQNQPKEQK